MKMLDIDKFKEVKPSPDGRFSDCWYWTRFCNDKGYGTVGINVTVL